MNNLRNQFFFRILNLHRYSKRLIVILIDISLCILCTWFSYIIRLEEIILLKDFNFYPSLISVSIAIPILWLFGSYKTILRYSNSSIIFNILTSLIVYSAIYFLIIAVYTIQGVPRSIGAIQPMILFFGIVFSRFTMKFIIDLNLNSKKFLKKKILIYGAGDAGRQLDFALENSLEFKVVGFLDDNKKLQTRTVSGKIIYSPLNLKIIIQKLDISIVLLAIPSINRNKRNQIINNLNNFGIKVKTLPSISEIIDGKVTISDIRDLNVDDLIDRQEIKADHNLLNKNINSKIILVTGAGGSIGSELCRQIIKLNPKKLILIELNEYSLYKISEKLKNLNKNLEIVPILANIQDQNKLEAIFESFKVDTVYHAAAYKHVPLVEENVCEGVKNNVFGTLAVANASIIKNVTNLVLISSDKAVRPTNIMGASKRLSELCLQSICKNNKNLKTNFSIVRFGNVLESSGSLIPKLKTQIKAGGPVTLTHKDVTRYFMTNTEAAQLVIQAGAMGKNAEVFVLDMGKSIKIKDLIYKIITLSGLTVKDHANPNGDIEVKIIGLRPGEKLYEELLIGDNPQKTEHPKVQKIDEIYIPYDQLEPDLDNLKMLLDNNKVKDILEFFKIKLKLYNPNSEIVDHIYKEIN